MNILNKGKPKHKRMNPRRQWRKLLTALAVAASMAVAPAAMADTGIDTASYQGCWDSAQAKSSGVNFAFIKLNQGTGYVNPYATCQVNAARANGIREGAYDFASPQTSSPEAEADKFVAEARARGMVGRAIPVLDWEPSAPGGYWGKQTWWALRWVNRVKATWGVNPMIYMSAAMIPTGDWSAVVATNAGLWVAGYPRGYAGDRLRNPGAVPYSVNPWPFAAAWQYSSSGAVGGIGGAVDVNWFYGDAVTWAKYAGAPASSVTSNATTPPKNNKTNGAPVADANTLASAVIRGEYGNDPQRRQLLGSRYGGHGHRQPTPRRILGQRVRKQRRSLLRRGQLRRHHERDRQPHRPHAGQRMERAKRQHQPHLARSASLLRRLHGFQRRRARRRHVPRGHHRREPVEHLRYRLAGRRAA